MDNPTIAFIVVGVLFISQCWLTIWSRNPGKIRHFAVVLCILSIPVVAIGALSSLSWSRPSWAMYGITGKVTVLGVKMVKDVAIYVYIDQPGEPRSIRLPWSDKVAEQLQDMLADPANKGGIKMTLGEGLDDHEPQFWTDPQPPQEEKSAEPEAPHLEM
jgi:hypothetical protein